MKLEQTKTKNILLMLLSPTAFDAISPFMQYQHHDEGMVIVEKNELFKYAYFPEAGFVSSVVETERDFPVEVGVVGREGFAGVPMLLGTRSSKLKLFSQLDGYGWQIDSGDFERILIMSSEIRQVCNSFIMTAMFQATQTIACNRNHSLKQRCARWLLTATEREPTRSVSLTRRYLAMMIGYEQRVAKTLRSLKDANLIRYDTDSVLVNDRDGLEALACECYAEVKANFDQAMGLTQL
jgi:CRP-like cAMP-binding protein